MLAGLALTLAMIGNPQGGTITFRGQVVVGQAGGTANPRSHHTVLTQHLLIRLVPAVDPHTQPPRLVIRPGGTGTMLTITYL